LYGVHTQEDKEIAENNKLRNLRNVSNLRNVEIKMPNNIGMKQVIDTNLNNTIKSLEDSQATDVDIADITKNIKAV